MRRYQHVQLAWMPIGILGIAAVSAAAMAVRVSENLMPALVVSVFLLTPLLCVGAFTVTVTDDEIVLRSGLGLFRTCIPVNAVRSCEPVHLPWYYGWDHEVLPSGTRLYNASGSEAVDVWLADGRFLRIGTNDGDAFVAALRRVIPAHAVQGAQTRVSPGHPTLAVLACLFVPMFVAVALMSYISTRAVVVTVSRDQLSVSGGIFRNEIPMKDVEHVSLEAALPAVQERVNAFTFGDSLRGRYLLEDAGPAHLFVERGSPPYIQVRTATNVVWINFKDPGRTRDLYARLVGTGALSR